LTTKTNTIITGILALSLTGCFSDEKSLYSICGDSPQVCDDIKTQGWCKGERTELIRNRYRQQTEPNNHKNLYDTLLTWKTFNACIEKASNIKRKKVTDRDPTKAATFVTSVLEIQKLEKLTKSSNYPDLLYYHWVEYGDDSKIDKLVSLDRKGKLNTSDLQFKMSTYYGKVNREKAVNSLLKGLSLLTESQLETLDHNVFASLTTYYYQMKKLELSYTWAQVAVKFGLKANLYSSLTVELQRKDINLSELDLKADDIYQSIQDLKFQYSK